MAKADSSESSGTGESSRLENFASKPIDWKIRATPEREVGRRSGQGRLLILCGVPGVGKSSWIKDADLGNDGIEVEVVSKDAIRNEWFGSLILSHPEDQRAARKIFNDVRKEFENRLKNGLESGKTLVADATHLHSSSRAELVNIAREREAIVELVVFSDSEAALKRNRSRDIDAQVPAQAAERFQEQWPGAIRGIKGEIKAGDLYDRVQMVSSRD